MKRGISKTTQILVIIILILIFVLLVSPFLFKGLPTRIVRGLNVYILSPIGKVIPLPQISEFEAEEMGLKAVISSNPPYEEVLCTNETIFLSAAKSTLPKGTSWSDVICSWDLDLSIDSDNADGDNDTSTGADDDADATECNLEKQFFQPTMIQLKIITREGLESKQQVEIETSFYGFCIEEMSPLKISNGTITTIEIPQNQCAMSARVWVTNATTDVYNVSIDVGNDGSVEWSSRKITGKTMISNFYGAINDWLENNFESCTEKCQVPISWKIDKGELEIVDVKIPVEVCRS